MEDTRHRRSPGSTVLRAVAIGIVVGACLTALVLRTGEEDLVPCSLFTEFTPCGHQTDYRIPTRIGIVALGVVFTAVLFRLARRLDERTTLPTRSDA
jgi:hypothetical protein